MAKHLHRVSDKNIEEMIGVCTTCGPVKLSKQSGGRYACSNRVTAEWKRRDAKRAKPHRPAVVKSHGLTAAEAREYLKDKVCRICGTKEKLVVDHCHKTLKIRGALCNSHNLAIGLFKDNAEHLRIAADYVEA